MNRWTKLTFSWRNWDLAGKNRWPVNNLHTLLYPSIRQSRPAKYLLSLTKRAAPTLPREYIYVSKRNTHGPQHQTTGQARCFVRARERASERNVWTCEQRTTKNEHRISQNHSSLGGTRWCNVVGVCSVLVCCRRGVREVLSVAVVITHLHSSSSASETVA